MLRHVKEKLARRFFFTTSGKDSDSCRHKMHVNGFCSSFLVSSECDSTVDVVTKKARVQHETKSLQNEAAFCEALARSPVDLDELRSLCRSGCPAAFRCEVWGLLTGVLHPSLSNRAPMLARKREEYVEYVKYSYNSVDWSRAFDAAEQTCAEIMEGKDGMDNGYWSKKEIATCSSLTFEDQKACCADPLERVGVVGNVVDDSTKKVEIGMQSCVAGESELLILKQIRKDVPRMSAGVHYLQNRRVMLSIERILYLWALRHPACGYVQGMNDLLIPFISIVLAGRFCFSKTSLELYLYSKEEVELLFSSDSVSDEEWMGTVEADTYWMTSFLLGAVQENYTYNQKGVHRMVRTLESVIRVIDAKLYHHLCEELQISFDQFAFRWMNCLLLRELNATQSLRLWDAYLADAEREWSTTHVYVCAALLLRWSSVLCREMDCCVAIKFLHNLPTDELSEWDISALVSQGIVMQKLYNNTLNHLIY